MVGVNEVDYLRPSAIFPPITRHHPSDLAFIDMKDDHTSMKASFIPNADAAFS